VKHHNRQLSPMQQNHLAMLPNIQVGSPKNKHTFSHKNTNETHKILLLLDTYLVPSQIEIDNIYIY